VVRFANSERRIPVSANSRMIAVSRREIRSFPAQDASSALVCSLVSISVRGSGTFGGLMFSIGEVSSSPSRTHQGKELTQPGVVAVLRRRRDLALQAHQPAAHVVGRDGGHVVAQILSTQPDGELDDGAGVVVEGLRRLPLGLERELEAG
jgi:hypothetical protein